MKTICIFITLLFSLFISATVISTGTQAYSGGRDISLPSRTVSQNTDVSDTEKQHLQDSFAPSEITHFFTHCLIAYPEIAFKNDNFMRGSYAADCVTVEEFKIFLDKMYHNNYVLIDVRDSYTSKGNSEPLSVKVPTGKKPLVLSFDDVNYYKKKMHLGMNDRLVVENGEIATYTQNAGVQYNYNNEHITILENFIKMHPDFSYHNARGVICLTGFDGVLGYRTENGSPNQSSEIARAKNVIATLKSKGWIFACHSYAHYHTKRISEAVVQKDTLKWLDEVGSLVGETDIYCYPYGEWDLGDGKAMSEKQKILNDSGFRVFFGVGAKNFYGFAPWNGNKNASVLLMDRKPYDGIALRNFQKEYSPYFDCEKIYQSRLKNYPSLAAK